jgi:hypothetical protein
MTIDQLSQELDKSRIQLENQQIELASYQNVNIDFL